MATSRVAPTSSKVQSSRCSLPPDKSELKYNPVGANSLVGNSFLSSPKLNPDHWLFKASSPFAPTGELCQSVGRKEWKVDYKSGLFTPCKGGKEEIVNGGIFGVFGCWCPQHSTGTSFKPVQMVHQDHITLPVLLPATDHRLKCLTTAKSQIMPVLPHFEVEVCSQSRKGGSLKGFPASGCDQVSQQPPYDPVCFLVTETTTAGSPDKTSTTSNNSRVPDCKDNAALEGKKPCDIINTGCGSCCDDEIVLGSDVIHAGVDCIHITDDDREYCTDSEHQEQCDDDISPLNLTVPTLLSPVSVDSNSRLTDSKPHLTVSGDCKSCLTVNTIPCRLKKLLSNESGYESVSCDAPSSSCDWSAKDATTLCYDGFDEWDDDESTDGESESADETAEILWKTFEDCMFSPESLHIPAIRMKSHADATFADATTSAGMMQCGSHERNLCSAGSAGHDTLVHLQADVGSCSRKACTGTADVFITTDSEPANLDHETSVFVQSGSRSSLVATDAQAGAGARLRNVAMDMASQEAATCVTSDPQLHPVFRHQVTSDPRPYPNHVTCDSRPRPAANRVTSDPRPHPAVARPDHVTCDLRPEGFLHQTTTSPRRRVHFPCDSNIAVVHLIVAWNFAYEEARRGPWEQYARDRAHFRRKVDNLAKILEPCLVKKMARGPQ